MSVGSESPAIEAIMLMKKHQNSLSPLILSARQEMTSITPYSTSEPHIEHLVFLDMMCSYSISKNTAFADGSSVEIPIENW